MKRKYFKLPKVGEIYLTRGGQKAEIIDISPLPDRFITYNVFKEHGYIAQCTSKKTGIIYSYQKTPNDLIALWDNSKTEELND